jgi:regulatory protein
VAAEAAAAELERVGLLDDRKLAESLVRKQMGAKPAGKRVLVAKLRQRGIPGATAEEAVKQGTAGRDELADAVDLARRKARLFKAGEDPQVARRRLFAYLARRGFDGAICRAAVGRVTGDSGGLGVL